ncbi:MAG: urease accessory protein UreJ [Limnobacter sp.]|nr:urease accessory protein UreJ [Limnobacter sp.]
MNRYATVRAALAPILISAAGAAAAHPGVDGGLHHGFWAGLAHPLTGLDHLIAILAAGFLGAALGRRGWLIAAAFPLAMLAGALLAVGGFAVPTIEPMIAVSLLAIGLLIATRTAIAGPAAAALVAVFALFHGAAHGQELAGATAALLGMLAGTTLLLALGAAFGRGVRARGAWWPRATGVAVSLFGVALLVPLLAR